MVDTSVWRIKPAAHRVRFRIQNYGMPPASLASYRHADIFDGEGFEWRTLSATNWASSASHLFGKPVTSSETWTWLHSPAFRATPLDLKAEARSALSLRHQPADPGTACPHRRLA